MLINMRKSEYECEVCGVKETLTPWEAFSNGWDYPPFIGEWGVVSPRTCRNCSMTETAWWAIMNHLELTEKHHDTIKRISEETSDV